MIGNDDNPPNKAILERLYIRESQLFSIDHFQQAANAGLLELLTQSQKLILKLSRLCTYTILSPFTTRMLPTPMAKMSQ